MYVLSTVMLRNSDFCHHRVFMCSLGTFNTHCFHNINRLDLVVIECVFCKIGIEFLNVIHISASVQVVKCMRVLVGIWFTIR